MTIMKIPIYRQDEGECPDGMYLALFHGRKTKAEDMDEMGFNGPIIGPLKYVHTTYDSNVKIAFAELGDPLGAHERISLYGIDNEHNFESILFRTEEGLFPFKRKFYGDWTVFNLKDGKVVQ